MARHFLFSLNKNFIQKILTIGDKVETHTAARKKIGNFSKQKQPCYVCQVNGENLDSYQTW